MGRLCVLTWLWTQPGGRTYYSAQHVNVLADMVSRHLSLDHEMACVTDTPEGIDPRVRIIPPPGDYEDITLPTWTRGRPQCLRRLALFRRDAADIFGAERIVSMDLDVVITGALDGLFSGGEDFRICRGTARARPFNGSLVMLRAGSRPEVIDTFSKPAAIAAGKKYVGSDQSWLSHVLGLRGEATWGPEHGVVAWQQRAHTRDCRLMTFPGALKPWQCKDLFVVKHYRRTSVGRCLMLGYGAGLWSDVASAIGAGFDAVIASPEAAAHWPGKPLAIADDDEHAEQLAAMHGLEPVWCGRSMGVA